MICPKCQAEIAEGDRYCPSCCAPIKPPGLLSRFLTWLGISVSLNVQSTGPTDVYTGTLINKSEHIEVLDHNTGEKKIYNSLDELPPELRSQLKSMRGEANAGPGLIDPNTLTPGFQVKTVVKQRFTYKDPSGRTLTYNSLDEMPLEVRAIFEKARKNLPPDSV